MNQLTGTFTKAICVSLIQIYCIFGVENSWAQRSYSIKVPNETKERLKEIYEEGVFSPESFRATWLPDGSGYMVLEIDAESNDRSLVRYKVTSGNRKVIISSAQLTSENSEGSSYSIDSYVISLDGENILLQASCKGDKCERAFWILEIQSGEVREVEAGYNNRFSPDGQKILFSDSGNLYVYDIQSEATIELTTDESEGPISNNRALWSPDSKKVIFVQADASDVRLRSSLVPGDPSYPEVKETRFARVDGNIAVLRVGVVNADGKETRWLSIPIPKEGSPKSY